MTTILSRSFVIMILALCVSGCANEKDGLKIILPQWKEAWNSGDISKIISLMHPKSEILEQYNSDNETKKAIEAELYELIDEFGKIDKWKIGKYIKSKKQYFVRITYTKKGTATGTISAAKDSGGTWLIMHFAIGG
jgi:hypothetical protein